MQTFSFIMGITSVVILALVASIVVGGLRIIRLERRNRQLESRLEGSAQHLNSRLNELLEQLMKESQAHRRDLNIVEHTLRNQIDANGSLLREAEKSIQESQKEHSVQLDRRLEELGEQVNRDLKGQVWEWISEQNRSN